MKDVSDTDFLFIFVFVCSLFRYYQLVDIYEQWTLHSHCSTCCIGIL